MSNYLGPSVLTNGLIFQYDMGNTKKSWKGPPTTNIITSATVVTAGQFIITDASTNSVSLPDTSTGWVGRYNATLAASTQYTLSFEYRSNRTGTTFNIDNDSASDNVFNTAFTCTTDWQTFTKTVTSTTAGDTTIWFQRTGGGAVYVRNAQLEARAYASPFVFGTRSSTQTLVDLTGISTITANNLTYNSDNTFEFSGTGQYMSYNGQAMGSSTIEFVIYNPGTQSDSYPSIHQQVPQNTTNGYTWIYISGNSTSLNYQYCNGTYTSTSFASAIASSGHTHVAFVADHAAQTVTLYKNGELLATNSVPNIRPIAAATAYIGNYQGSPNADYDFKGKLPVYRVYDRTLSASEVKNNFNSLRGRFGL